MPRPCTCDRYRKGEPFDPALDCQSCFLWHTHEPYRLHHGGRMPLPCLHLGPATGATAACPTCSGSVRIKLRACAIHDNCTENRPVPGHACCVGCLDQHAPDPFGAPVVRNLLLHVLPVAGNGVWQRVVGMFRDRLSLFNGRRVVAVLTERGCPPLDPPGAVMEALGGECEYVIRPNDPNLREVATYEALFGAVATDAASEATLYAHAKGVTQPPGHTAHEWTRLLIETCCDYWPLVERLLREHPCAAPFVRRIRGWNESTSEWHPSGSFWWFRSRDWFAVPDWRQRVDRFWSGIEGVASKLFPHERAACIFFPFHRPGPGLYDRGFFEGEVLPAYEDWKRRHAHDRKEW